MSKAQFKRFGMTLKPCPFCGKRYKGTNIVWKGWESRFECPDCAGAGPYISEEDKKGLPLDNWTDEQAHQRDIGAIKAWNRRAESLE